VHHTLLPVTLDTGTSIRPPGASGVTMLTFAVVSERFPFWVSRARKAGPEAFGCSQWKAVAIPGGLTPPVPRRARRRLETPPRAGPTGSR
jgi:hypothetical protein